MAADRPTVLIMAAGTGGHVFPALVIADRLRRKNARVEWLGTRHGMENKLLEHNDYKLHQISVSGLRGTGLLRKLLAPFMLLTAFVQSLRVIARVKPDCVLGMGGFVCGPAGVASWIRGKPLLLHEQNAVAGLTNRLLAPLAQGIFEAFPGTFKNRNRVIHSGNPVRQEITDLQHQERTVPPVGEPLNLLVLGGSRGAEAINRTLPELLANWGGSELPRVLHQTGQGNLQGTRDLYRSLELKLSERIRVEPFIDDMASAYSWADVVICRAGASTVSELAVAGLPAILVPYPHHRDQQQLLNGRWLSDAGAAFLLPQEELSAKNLLTLLRELDRDRERLAGLGRRARALAVTDAGGMIADRCLEVARG